MKALSIRQPWAHLIVRADITDPAERAAAHRDGAVKLIENRTWKTKHRGPFLIHAAVGMTYEEWLGALHIVRQVEKHHGVAIPMPSQTNRFQLVRGGIIGIADLVDCRTDSESPWYMGKVAFVLDNVRPLPFTPLKGALQFFNVPDDIVRSLGVSP